jgi:hypothetical protein
VLTSRIGHQKNSLYMEIVALLSINNSLRQNH